MNKTTFKTSDMKNYTRKLKSRKEKKNTTLKVVKTGEALF